MAPPSIRDVTPDALAAAAAIVASGGIVICPSDANYGIAVDPFDARAVAACFDAKRRPGQKPLTLFISDPDDWVRFGRTSRPELMRRLAGLYWPGPLNIVIDKTDGAPALSLDADLTISIACHRNPAVRGLARACGGAVAMTSANLSGTSDGRLVDIELAVAHLGDQVDLVLRGEPIQTTTSTTIVRIDEGLHLLREGDLTFRAVLDAVGEPAAS